MKKLCSYGHCIFYRKGEHFKSSEVSHAGSTRSSGKSRFEVKNVFGKLSDGKWAVLSKQ